MTFGQRVAKIRKEKKMTQDELAKKIGYTSRSTISKIERDERDVPRPTVTVIAEALGIKPSALMGWEDEETLTDTSNISYVIPNNNIFQIPVFESVSAGFGAYASSEILEYIPVVLNSRYEADNTLAIKVKGDSMYPKIEDGDVIIVRKQSSVDSGDIAVLLLDNEEGLVKKVEYGSDWIELISFNPEYAPRRFEKEDVLRLQVVGKVIGSYKAF